MVYNAGGLEIFYDRLNDPIVIPPRTAFDLPYDRIPLSKTLRKIETYTEVMKGVCDVAFIRRYALGDVLMFLPVAREFKEKHPDVKIHLITNKDPARGFRFIEIFNEGIFSSFMSDTRTPRKYDVSFYLDNLVERDLYLEKYHSMHRVDIFREFFGYDQKQEPVWSLEQPTVGTGGIVFCHSGSKPLKTIPKETVDYLVPRLEKIAPVYVMGENRKIPPDETVKLLRDALVLITVDSAALWMAHFTRTPVVFLSGPSRGSERISKHPLRPEGATEVSLSKLIGCVPCFEKMEACGSKYKCMYADKEKVWQEIEAAVERVRWKI